MRIVLVALCLLLPSALLAAPKPVPRVLEALYDSRYESSPRSTLPHRFLEMPANHLGFDMHFTDINAKLPVLGDDVAGVVVWLDNGTEVPDAKTYIAWLKTAVDAGKKLIIIENGGIGDKYHNDADIMRGWNEVLSHIGLQDDGAGDVITYHAAITILDKQMYDFERKIFSPLPPLAGTRVLAGSGAKTHLRIQISDAGEDSSFDMVTTSPHGGFVAPGYAMFMERETKPDGGQVWYVNPFLFLRKSLDVGVEPIPDTTTLDGRRIFYAHIDGDGWNNVSEIPKYQEKIIISAEVIEDEVLKPYSEFAFNVGLITGDVDTTCYGIESSERVAREIFALPNVEPASHTFTHPLYWDFFADYTPEKEKPLLDFYPPKVQQRFSFVDTVRDLTGMTPSAPPADSRWFIKPSPDPTKPKPPLAHPGKNDDTPEQILKQYRYTPRSYACGPFNLDQEIKGALATVNTLSPPNKKARLLQWPGDTSPFELALAKVREAGLLNINGGDSRFDKEYPSYSFVAPIGLLVGKERQIYSSNSNEETYTDLWRDRFYGYRYLQATVQNTDSPIRVSPFNLYFHMFSGEKQASLDAVKDNLNFARRQNIISITASDYAAIADGFFSAEITKAGDRSWRISNRGDLQTLRFDNAGDLDVDLAASRGVIGERLYQNSLYVALDPAVGDVLLTLKPSARKAEPDRINLVQSTWQIRNVKSSAKTLTFDASGHGIGYMVWRVPAGGKYRVKIAARNAAPEEKDWTAGEDGLLHLAIDHMAAGTALAVSMERQ